MQGFFVFGEIVKQMARTLLIFCFGKAMLAEKINNLSVAQRIFFNFKEKLYESF